jgi:hypothetical protein
MGATYLWATSQEACGSERQRKKREFNGKAIKKILDKSK